MPTLEQARQRSERRAYEAGRNGRAFSVDLNDPVPVDELQSIYDNARAERDSEHNQSPAGADVASPAGAAARAETKRSTARRGRSFARPGSPHMVNDGAGFVLGLVGYALFINFVRGGRNQARAWVAAKFLNRPLGGPVNPEILNGGGGHFLGTHPSTPSVGAVPGVGTVATASPPIVGVFG